MAAFGSSQPRVSSTSPSVAVTCVSEAVVVASAITPMTVQYWYCVA